MPACLQPMQGQELHLLAENLNLFAGQSRLAQSLQEQALCSSARSLKGSTL